MMQTSDAGIYALALHEGIVPAPYKDSVGVMTYGIGHTAAAGSPNPAEMPRGMPSNLDAALADVFRVFSKDLARYEADVNRALKVKVTQAQFDALVSFHYNTGAIGRATLVKRLNAGDVNGAAAGFMSWVKPKEITERRRQEQTLFAKGVYPTGQVTVWSVTTSGNVVWKPVRRLTKDQVLGLLRGGLTRPAPQVNETPKSEHVLASSPKPAPSKPATTPDIAKKPNAHPSTQSFAQWWASFVALAKFLAGLLARFGGRK